MLPFFSAWPVVMTLMLVTSLPVPEVVGTWVMSCQCRPRDIARCYLDQGQSSPPGQPHPVHIGQGLLGVSTHEGGHLQGYNQLTWN